MWGLQETMAILGTSQPSSTPPHSYPFGMPQGGSAKHSLHQSDSDLPQIPSGLLHCVIPYSHPAVFSQGLADCRVLQLPSHAAKGWTHILKYTALSKTKQRQRGGSAKHPIESILQNNNLCPSVSCCHVQRAFKDKTPQTSLNSHAGYEAASASSTISEVFRETKLHHSYLKPLLSKVTGFLNQF